MNSAARTSGAIVVCALFALGCSSSRRSMVDGGDGDGQPNDGRASDGSISDGPHSDSTTPSAPVTAVSLGELHSCALAANGEVWCWGNNLYSQLGDGKSYDCPADVGDCSVLPVRVAELSTATQIASGYTTSCAVLKDGSGMCWGSSADPVTLGGATSGDTPVAVHGLSDAVEIAAGRRHFCARDTSGRVWCWGENDKGQLGGSSLDTTLVEVDGIGVVTALSAGSAHTCAIVDSTVWCWGDNEQGQLGRSGDGFTPKQVDGLTDVIQVAGGGDSTCALKDDGTVWCWGDNILGALGSGDYADTSTPAAVQGISDVAMIATGMGHTCALKNDGNVSCWGAADWGELGDGKKEHGCTVISSGFAHDCSPSPVRVVDLPASTQIAVGASHSCALGKDGHLRCWGSNIDGELGDGSTESRNTPVEVVGL